MCHTHTVSILWEFCFLHVKCHDGVTENDVQFARSIFAVFLSCYLLYKVTANVCLVSIRCICIKPRLNSHTLHSPCYELSVEEENKRAFGYNDHLCFMGNVYL